MAVGAGKLAVRELSHLVGVVPERLGKVPLLLARLALAVAVASAELRASVAALALYKLGAVLFAA
jgi:hypothetical protein